MPSTGGEALGGPGARAADQMLKCSLNGCWGTYGPQCQAQGHSAWDRPQCVIPIIRKLTELTVKAKQRAQETAAARTDHGRGTALAWTRGASLFYEYLLHIYDGDQPIERLFTLCPQIKKTHMTRSYHGSSVYLSNCYCVPTIAPTHMRKMARHVCEIFQEFCQSIMLVDGWVPWNNPMLPPSIWEPADPEAFEHRTLGEPACR